MITGEPKLPSLAPEFEAFLALLPAFDLSDDSLETVRPLMADEAERVPLDGVHISDLLADGRRGGGVAVRRYQPAGDAPPEGRPALLWIHGGGYVMGSYRNDAELLERLVAELGLVCLSVEYRLAPEHPFPAPLEDCYTALEWAHHHADELGLDPTRIGIGGLSAGGGLCAGLALLAGERGEVPVAFQLLDSPMLDDRRITVSARFDDLPLWTQVSNIFGWSSYLGELSGADELPAPAAAGRVEDLALLAGLPPTLVMVGAVDGFRDEDVAYATRLAAAGVDCELHVYPGAPHGIRLFGDTPTARQSYTDTARWLARQIHR